MNDILDTGKEMAARADAIVEGVVDYYTGAMALETIKALKKELVETEKRVQAKLIDKANSENVRKAEVGNGLYLLFSKAKKNRFETQEIYKALNVSQEVIDILPKNPAFSVTAVRANEKISHLTFEEIDETVELKASLVDGKYLKGSK